MIFKRGNGEQSSASVFVVDCISESRSWSRPGMQGVEFSAPLYVYDSNVALAACRQQKTDGFNHIFASDEAIESSFVSNKTAEITSGFPLFVQHSTDGRRANFDEAMLEELFSEVEEPIASSRKVHPEDILDYIYASLHSPKYREKYKEFLKLDFPRVPRPKSWDSFWKFVEIGREIRELHLLSSPLLENYETTFSEPGSNAVDKVHYEDERVYINQTQFFGKVSEVAWNFFIGGYQPAQKWLKDREGGALSDHDIEHYQQIIKALIETDRLMRSIDEVDG